MGKKKKKESDKPWCFYCDRIFNDEATLVLHQKSKHFKCTQCNKKLSSAQGLVVHAYQVHKEDIRTVPGAKPGRDSIDIEIFGMAGVPEGMRPGDDEPKAKKAKTEPKTGPSSAAEAAAAAAAAPVADYGTAVDYGTAADYGTNSYSGYHQPATVPPVPGGQIPPGVPPPAYSSYGYSYSALMPYPGAPPPYLGPPPPGGLPPPGMMPPPMGGPGPGPQPYPPSHIPPPGGMMPPHGLPPPMYPGPGPGGPMPPGPGPLFPITSQPPAGPLFPVPGAAPAAPLFPVAGASVGVQHNDPGAGSR